MLRYLKTGIQPWAIHKIYQVHMTTDFIHIIIADFINRYLWFWNSSERRLKD